MEGLALYADPNFKVLAASYPYFAKRLLTDPNPYLRDALIELLFKDGKFRYVFLFSSLSYLYTSSYLSWILVGVIDLLEDQVIFGSLQVEQT